MYKKPRRVCGWCRRLAFGSAVLWFTIEAVRIFEATFGFGYGISYLYSLLERQHGIGGWIGTFLKHAYPLVLTLAGIVVRTEASRWLRERRKGTWRRATDRLLIAGTTFVTTLLLVDLASPNVKLVLPESTVITIVSVVIIQIGSWASRLLHNPTRRVLRRRVRRFLPMLSEFLQKMFTSSLGTSIKKTGGRDEHPSNHSNKRRAA